VLPRTNFKNLRKKLARQKPGQVDKAFHGLHVELFSLFDCLTCAACCKSISPSLYDRDIERIAKRLRITPAAFIQKYLKVDEEQDYVFRATPCPFLLEDNCCNIYDDRPRACREYPHTDRKNMLQILDLTIKNAEVCPVVKDILVELDSDEG
jgi:uncharacterized protein